MVLPVTTLYACPGPPLHRQTFLKHVPSNVEQEDIVAKVQIVNTEIDPKTHKRMSQVRVLEAIKGVKETEHLTVVSSVHSCAKDANVTLNEIYVIAGSLNEDGYFVGEWRGDIVSTGGHYTKW